MAEDETITRARAALSRVREHFAAHMDVARADGNHQQMMGSQQGLLDADAIRDAIDLVDQGPAEPSIYELSDDDLPGMWSRSDFMGGQDAEAERENRERNELWRIFDEWLIGNEGRETADASASLDYGLELLDTWTKRHTARVAAKAMREAAHRMRDLLDCSGDVRWYKRLLAEADKVEAGS